MINIILQASTQQYDFTNIWIFIALNPILDIFYFGVFSGVLFMYIKNNAPNRLDVFIGKRIGNILRLHTEKHPSDKKTDMTWNGGMYYFDSANIKLEKQHGLFSRPVYIFDEDNSTSIKTTKPNVPIEEKKETVTKKNGQTVTITRKVKSKNYPIDVDLDTQWNVSARKLYNWWKNKMMETTWRAIIGKTISGDYFTMILYLGLGAIIGALTLYSIEPTHVIIVPHLINSTITSSTTTTFHT